MNGSRCGRSAAPRRSAQAYAEAPYGGRHPDYALLVEAHLLGTIEIAAQLILDRGAAAVDGKRKRVLAGKVAFGRSSGVVVAAEQNLLREGDGFGERRVGYGAGRFGGGLDGDE